MRPSCLNCCRKHLAQASVLATESRLGYPLHRWLAVGHLAEAEDEILERSPEIAKQIRIVRRMWMDDNSFAIDFLQLIAMVTALEPATGGEPATEREPAPSS